MFCSVVALACVHFPPSQALCWQCDSILADGERRVRIEGREVGMMERKHIGLSAGESRKAKHKVAGAEGLIQNPLKSLRFLTLIQPKEVWIRA